MSDDLTISDTIKPYLPIIGAVIRGLVQIASGFGFTWALAVTGDQITMATTAAAMLATLLWSAWQKVAAIRDSRRAEVAAAKASAALGQPVTVTVTSPDRPNIATPVPVPELMTAPTAPTVATAAVVGRATG